MTWEQDHTGPCQHRGQTQSVEFRMANSKRFHKGPNPPEHENHMGSHHRGSQTQFEERLESTGWLPGPSGKLVCTAGPASTCEHSNSTVKQGEMKL